MSVKSFIENKVEDFNDWIKKDLSSDSGKTARSLRVESTNNSVKSIGADYIEILNRGSHPWSNPSKYKSLGYRLKDWAKNKGLNPFAVAWNIAHYGNQIFQGKKKGLDIETKKEKLIKEIKTGLPKEAKAEVLQVLNKFTQQYLNEPIAG